MPIGRFTITEYPLAPDIFVISPAAGAVVADAQLVTVIVLQLAIEVPLLGAVAVAVITFPDTRAGLIALSVHIPALTVVEPIETPSL